MTRLTSITTASVLAITVCMGASVAHAQSGWGNPAPTKNQIIRLKQRIKGGRTTQSNNVRRSRAPANSYASLRTYNSVQPATQSTFASTLYTPVQSGDEQVFELMVALYGKERAEEMYNYWRGDSVSPD